MNNLFSAKSAKELFAKLSEEQKTDKDYILALIKGFDDVCLLKHVDERLRDDADFIIACLSNFNGFRVLPYISERLMNDNNFIKNKEVVAVMLAYVENNRRRDIKLPLAYYFVLALLIILSILIVIIYNIFVL